jgi:hypothetical protein
MTQTQLVRSLAESCEVNNKVARQFLREHPDMCRTLDAELRKALGLDSLQEPPRKLAAVATGGENTARKAV